MNKTLTLTALIGSLLLGACTTQKPTDPGTRQTLEGEVRLGATESGRPSPYQNAQAVGRTLTLHPVTTAQGAPAGPVLTRTTVRADLWYTLRLPDRPAISENAAPALLGAPDEEATAGCETAYKLDNPAARTMRTTFRLDLGDADEALALNPTRRSGTDDGAVQGRTAQLVYADADVREQHRTLCGTLVGQDKLDSDLNLKRGWNVVITEDTTTVSDAGFVTTQRKVVTDDLTHHLVLAR